MAVDRDKSTQFRTLEALMDRLSAPDLTLHEAKDLLPRLARLLDQAGESSGTAVALGSATFGTPA